MIELEILTKILRDAEKEIITTAVKVLRKQVPNINEASAIMMYANENLRSQEDLAALSAQLSLTATREYHKYCQKTSNHRENMMEEGLFATLRAAEERIEMVHRESDVYDAKLTHDSLRQLAAYVDGLQWRLKSAMKPIEK